MRRPDAGGMTTDSPVVIVMVACVSLVVLSAMWLLITFSDLCCCLQRQQRRRSDSAEDRREKSVTASAGNNQQTDADRAAADDSVQYVDESDQKHAKEETPTRPASEKRSVFTLRREKTSVTQQEQDVSMKDRISAFESGGSTNAELAQGRDAAKPKKKKPSSKAFQEFERSGIIIGFGRAPRKQHKMSENEEQEYSEGNDSNDVQGQMSSVRVDNEAINQIQTDDNSNTNSLNRLTDDEGIHTMDEEDEFSAVTRQSEILKSFRRAPPPKNRSRANRALQKRISTRQEEQHFAGLDFPMEQDEESESSAATSPSRSTDSIVTPSDRATPDNDTATSGHHTGEDSPRGVTPDSINRHKSAAKCGSAKGTQQSREGHKSDSETTNSRIILLIGNDNKERKESETGETKQAKPSVKEVKEVSFKDFMALIRKSNSTDQAVSQEQLGSSDKKQTAQENAPPSPSENATALAENSKMNESASNSGSAQPNTSNNSKQPNRNNNNIGEMATQGSGPSHTMTLTREGSNGQLVLTRPRSFQPTSFNQARDSSFSRSNVISQNADIPARNRFSSLVTCTPQQSRSGAERSRSMSVGSPRCGLERWSCDVPTRPKTKDDVESDHKDADNTEDNNKKSFHETAI